VVTLVSLEERAEKIRVWVWADKYAERRGYKLNPDEDRVAEVIHGLAVREEKFGKRYCPCRIITGNDVEDRKIICPCIYHTDEIENEGACHCRLFVRSIRTNPHGFVELQFMNGHVVAQKLKPYIQPS